MSMVGRYQRCTRSRIPGLRISGFCKILRFRIRFEDVKYAVFPDPDFLNIVFLYGKN